MKATCESCKWFFVSYYYMSDGAKGIDDALCMYNPPVAGIGLPRTGSESCCSKHELKDAESGAQ